MTKRECFLSEMDAMAPLGTAGDLVRDEPEPAVPAVVLQHETDHLRGHLFIDRMKDLSTLTHLDEFGKFWIKGENDVREV